MDCEQSQIWMIEALDGHLAPARQDPLMAHLSACSRCRADWDALQATDELLSAASMVSPPPGFAARVEARLAHREAQRRMLIGGVILLLAALSLWLLALPSLLNGRGLLEAYTLFLRDAYGLIGHSWLILRTLTQTLWLTLNALIGSGGSSALNILTYGVGGVLAMLAWRRHLLMQGQGGRASVNGSSNGG